jgi:prevent-host-death family protein
LRLQIYDWTAELIAEAALAGARGISGITFTQLFYLSRIVPLSSGDCRGLNYVLYLVQNLVLKRSNLMSISFKEDILPISELKKNTKKILLQIRTTRRPVILTVNGKADSVIIDVESYEKQLKAADLAKLLLDAERDIAEQRTRPADSFLDEFKHEHKI